METLNQTDQQYKDWLIELKSKIRSTQIKASLAVNATFVGFYWELGKMISEKEGAWDSKLIERVAKNLQAVDQLETAKNADIFNPTASPWAIFAEGELDGKSKVQILHFAFSARQ